jgi:hypothetical protein
MTAGLPAIEQGHFLPFPVFLRPDRDRVSNNARCTDARYRPADKPFQEA